MATNKLKGVCIGAGYFSHFQYEAWQRIPEVEIVAFSNRDPVKASEITRKFGLRKCYADYREMFDTEKPDFVDVITPPPSHQAICAEAAKRGIHIICQKALAPTFEEAKAIVANATAAQVRFMVHENFRFQPWHREIKRQLEAKAIGTLHSVAFRSRMGDGWGENAYIPRQPYFREYPRLLVFENGVHFVDTYRFLAGEISRVTSWHRRLNPVIKGEDCALVVFRVFQRRSRRMGRQPLQRNDRGAIPVTHSANFWLKAAAGSIRLAGDSRLTLEKTGRERSGASLRARGREFLRRLRLFHAKAFCGPHAGREGI